MRLPITLRPPLARLLAGLLLLMATPAAPFAAMVKWIVPPPESIVTASPVTVRGFISAPPAKPLKATVKKPGDPKPFDEADPAYMAAQIFSFKVNLAPGRNNIVLEDGVLSVYYLPDASARQSVKDAAGFSEVKIHKTTEKCEECHWVHDGELTLNANLPELCAKCHESTVKGEWKPVSKLGHHEKQLTGYCVACHDPHSSPGGKLLKGKGNACTGCHKNFPEGSGHEKAGDQPCVLCHDPHRSENDRLLKAEKEKLCDGCHREARHPVGDVASTHLPVSTQPCSTCHVHHRGENEKLLRAPHKELCLGCHKERTDYRGHKEKLDQCSDCHGGHATANQRLLKSDGVKLCLGCHKEYYAGGGGHPLSKGGGCFQCHNPHGRVEGAKAMQMCGGCHSLGAEAFSYVHGGLPFDTVRQCLTCHRMHSPKVDDAPRALMYGVSHYPIKNGGCLVCHTKDKGRIEMRYNGSENCVRCHGQTVGTSTANEPEKIHAPIRQEDCIACHSPHFKSYPHMLLDEQDKVCEFCHGAITRMGAVRHKALDSKDGCIGCHVPHFSDDRPLLKIPQPDACLKCHPGKMPKEGDPLAHGAMREGKCGGCHSPHTSEEDYLIKRTRGETCAGCHQEALRDAKGNPFAKLHGPVGANQCTACHYMGHLHKAEGDKFIEEKPAWKVCRECHPDITDEHVPSIYSYRLARNANGCLGCHFPHGAANQYLLRE